MRQIDKLDNQPLGDLVRREKPAPPPPQPVEVRPGIVRKPDGKLETAIPSNDAAK